MISKKNLEGQEFLVQGKKSFCFEVSQFPPKAYELRYVTLVINCDTVFFEKPRE